MIRNVLAIDLGATSGRAILATCDNDRVKETKEIVRFANSLLPVYGKLYWNIWTIYENIIAGLKKIAEENIQIDSIGIDAWGVDFVTVGKDGILSSLPRAYRDPYTDSIPDIFFDKIGRDNLYYRTGIQIMNFNTIFQLYAQTKEDCQSLKTAEKILFIPDAISYLLTGKMVCEETILSTGQMVNADTGNLDEDLLSFAGVSSSIFPKIVTPGEVIGVLSDNIRDITGLPAVPVVAVAGHDTASAVAAVPAQDENFAYISSGTWSLIGIEAPSRIINSETYSHNYTNEGGIDGTIRFLKNITGMWIMEQCLLSWKAKGQEYTYNDIIPMIANAEPCRFFIDPDDPVFIHPDNMLEAIENYCEEHTGNKPRTPQEIARCIIDSLAMKYRYALCFLQKCAPAPITKLHIIGGGSRNEILNQITANAVGLPVVAGPVEATALGNIAMQLRSLGVLSKEQMRQYINNSVETKTFIPHDTEKWETYYNKFISSTNLF